MPGKVKLTPWNRNMIYLRDWCRDKGIVKTDQEYFEKIGFTKTNLPKVLNGTYSFQIEHMIAAAKLTGASIDYICGLTTQMKRSSRRQSSIELIEEALKLLKSH